MIFFVLHSPLILQSCRRGRKEEHRGPGLRVSASPGLFLTTGHWACAPAAWEGAWPHVCEDEGCCRACPAWGEGVPGAGGLWLKKTWENGMETNPKRPPCFYRLKCKAPDSEGRAVVPQWLSLFNISIDDFLSLLLLVLVPNVWDPSNTSWYFFWTPPGVRSDAALQQCGCDQRCVSLCSRSI